MVLNITIYTADNGPFVESPEGMTKTTPRSLLPSTSELRWITAAVDPRPRP